MQQQEAVQTLTKLFGDLIEKLKEQSQQQPLTPLVVATPKQSRVPRAANMTYFQYLSKVLRESPPQAFPNPTKKSSYRLHQDLQIFLEMANHNNITAQVFEQVANKGKINRTAESIRNRFQEFLSKVQEKDMKKIVEYVEKDGIEGFIVFQNGEFKIVKTDPREGKRTRPESLEKEDKKIERQIKRVVPPQCAELNNVLSVYSKMVNVPIPYLIEKLDQASGDLVTLDRYIETKDQRLLWSEEDDQVLLRGGVELQVLRRYRGDKDVEKRRAYLGIS